MSDVTSSITELTLENQGLRAQLAEAQEVIRAIQSGDVDAVVVSGPDGEKIFTLKGAERSYRVLVETMSEGAATLAADGTVLYCNQGLSDLTGVPQEQLIGGPVTKLIVPRFQPSFNDLFALALGRQPSRAEMQLRRGDNQFVPVYVSLRDIQDEEPTALCMIVTNLTEQKENETVIHDWKKRLELAEKAALPIGLWEWDVNSGALLWSDGMYRHFGYARNLPITQQDFAQRLHPEDRPRVESAIQEVVSGRSPLYEVQFRVLRPDGTTCWLDSRGVLVHPGSTRMIGIAIDVTQLCRTEMEYRSIVEAAPYGVFRSSPQGRFLMANPAMVAMLGYNCESELLSLDIARNVYCNPEERTQMVARLIASGGLQDVEADWKRKDGHTITVNKNVFLMRSPSGEIEGFQGFIQDISERKTLARQFWQAQKMEAIGRLAGGVAHDLNNVLMVVGSYSELILQRQMTDDKVHSYAGEINKASARGASVTRQLLAFSRQQVLELEVLDLNGVVTELSKILPKLLGEDIDFVTRLDPVRRLVKVDRGQMEQVIINLAVNARDAMSRGGRLEITTKNVELDDSPDKQPMKPGPYVKLSIVDTGTGMDAETQAHAFEPFFTTKERGKGTGLGLATVYGIIKQSGGFIWLASEIGRGTTFELYFPEVREPIKQRAKPQAKITSGGSETILLVEDEESLRTATCEFLSSKGYKVLPAGNGAEAMSICQQHAGAIDVMLTDIVMPGMDGTEVAKAVASHYPEIRVLYMSGYMDRPMEGLGAGAVLFQKPFSLSSLARKLREVLETPPPDKN